MSWFRYFVLALVVVNLNTPVFVAQGAESQDSFSDLADQEPESADPILNDGEEDIAKAVEKLMFQVIMLMGIAAVFVIVIVGVLLIVGIGSEESRARAIKVLLYVIAGILVIALASAFVRYVAKALFGQG